MSKEQGEHNQHLNYAKKTGNWGEKSNAWKPGYNLFLLLLPRTTFEMGNQFLAEQYEEEESCQEGLRKQ